MRILHVIEGMQESCGISRFVVEITRELKWFGEDVAIVTTRNWNVLADDITIFETFVPETASGKFNPQLVHLHGCWNRYIHRMACWCQAKNVPYVMSPHGAWTPWAWHYHRLKKRIAWLLFQKRDALRAMAFHATVESEYDDIHRLGLHQPVVIAPLGARIPNGAIEDISKREKIVLYLGRLHHKKNVHGLLEAWKSIPNTSGSGWRLLIAGKPGPGDDEYLEKLKNESSVNCSFVGEVTGLDKEKLYQSARVFVLPSFSENFGSVVLEALANGTPVITTSGTPWDNTVEAGCGWRTSADVKDLRKTMVRAIQTTDDELTRMSLAARQFVRENYSWEKSARTLVDAYQKVLEK